MVVDIGPTTPESPHYPEHGEASARLVASGDCRLGIILCGTGQGIMMAANKVRGIRCGVCADTFSARMIRQHKNANMISIGARVVGEGLALDIVDAFLTAQFEGGRHATRVAMIRALEGRSVPPSEVDQTKRAALGPPDAFPVPVVAIWRTARRP